MARSPVKRRPEALSIRTAKAPDGQADGRRRVAIEAVSPEVGAGRFPAKRSLGEKVAIEADVFADGHDAVACVIRYRHQSESAWTEVPMVALGNDRWRAELIVGHLGRYVYTIEGWVDRFQTWRLQLTKRIAAGQDVGHELKVGAQLVEAAAKRAQGADSTLLTRHAASLANGEATVGKDLIDVMDRYPDRSEAVTYPRDLEMLVDPQRARFSAWYELFPRSAGEAGKHGTFRDLEKRLPYIAGMGFDVLYVPPIHPIGRTNRKGANNSIKAATGEPGSPWAIGSVEGGHKSIAPELGTLDDFRHLLGAARDKGLDVALDLAFQCSPDHPYVREHPEWFRHRPDGSIQYAENPPKKYEDIVPFDFESEAWRELWAELLSIVTYWIDKGVRIFRIDNPHTKPFPFWEWLIGEVKRDTPDVIFLAEAFTRPKVMYRLAKCGFTQSYTYFAWRHTAWEITQYFTELTQSPVSDFFRPNLWTNTPDILTEYLQTGGRPAFAARLVLAATLGANYGIYGPAFELGEARAKEPGSEEYLDSEKYQLRNWNIDSPDSLREMITLVNEIRHENLALQSDRGLRFHTTENESLIAYTKSTTDLADVVLTVVNLDPHHTQAGMVTLPLKELGLETDKSYQAHELLSGARYMWNGPRNYVEINPHAAPAQIFRFRRRVRSEHDFEYFL
ncbi:MAG TPA: alpha-1,4-glucan--maltose-1-phosphate maltosyltransferase [Candidatus Micrarchaeaceae archaeon]|nr:alpha-1,4-glucan--maltose-1-phosphate maltosyltransferase [Candidatus Micrarchaeaceae archaeon]